MSTKKRKSIVSKKSSIKRAKKDYSFNLIPSIEEIDFLSNLSSTDNDNIIFRYIMSITTKYFNFFI